MRAKSVWAAPEFAETYRQLTVLQQEGKIDFDVEHVLKPKEGGLGWVDTWMVSSEADSERTELAHAWINLFLEKDNYVERCPLDRLWRRGRCALAADARGD